MQPNAQPTERPQTLEEEVINLRARVKELEQFKAGVNLYFSHLLNIQRDVMDGVEELGALLGKPAKSVNKKA